MDKILYLAWKIIILIFILLFILTHKGLFTIRTDAKNMNIEIYSILGNLVRKENIQNRVNQIDLSNEMSGVYFIKLKSGNNTEQRKLIIQ